MKYNKNIDIEYQYIETPQSLSILDEVFGDLIYKLVRNRLLAKDIFNFWICKSNKKPIVNIFSFAYH